MFLFDADSHSYYIDGKRIPSVTEILLDMGFVDSTWFNEYSRLRGSYLHEIIKYHLKGTLDKQSVDSQLCGYYKAWIKFENETNFIPDEVENPLGSSVHRFAGTPDYIGKLNGFKSIIDAKSGMVSAVTGLQTAAYKVLKGGHYKRYALQLRADGTYKLTQFSENSDVDIFLQSVSLWHWKKAHKIR